MHNIEEIKKRSISTNELVVEYMDAMDALEIFHDMGVKVLGWEGWLSYRNGSVGHSLRHQGTTDLSHIPSMAAIALAKATIMQAHTEWQESPEVPDAELFFCISLGT